MDTLYAGGRPVVRPDYGNYVHNIANDMCRVTTLTFAEAYDLVMDAVEQIESAHAKSSDESSGK